MTTETEDLYRILGVPKDATPNVIKHAYRRLAQIHHPDRDTGDQETFQRISRAYEILSDPERRKHYDETGSDIKVQSRQHKQWEELSRGFMDAVLKVPDVTQRDLIALVRAAVQGGIAKNQQMVVKFQTDIKRFETVKERLTRKNTAVGMDILTSSVDMAIRQAHANLQQLAIVIEDQTAMLGLLDEYEYRVDAGMTMSTTGGGTIFVQLA